jgi:hypothetical protein
MVRNVGWKLWAAVCAHDRLGAEGGERTAGTNVVAIMLSEYVRTLFYRAQAVRRSHEVVSWHRLLTVYLAYIMSNYLVVLF